MSHPQWACPLPVVGYTGGKSPLITANGYPTELAEQYAFVSWCKRLSRFPQGVPELDLLFAVPNGAVRDRQEATIKLMEGMRKGVPDLWVPAARKGYHGLVIEMKVAHWDSEAGPRGSVSTDQADYLKALGANGYYAVVAHGCAEAKAITRGYFDIPENVERECFGMAATGEFLN